MGFFDDVKDAVDDAADKAGDVADDVGNAVDDAVDAGQEAAGDIAEGAQEAGSEISEGASDVANEVSEGDVGGAVDEATETAGEVGDTATETAGNVVSGSSDSGSDAFSGGSSGGSSGGGSSSSGSSSGGSNVDVSVSEETVVETDNYEQGKEIEQNSGKNVDVKYKGDAKIDQQKNLLDRNREKRETAKKTENQLQSQIEEIKSSPSKTQRIAALQDRINNYKQKSAETNKVYDVTPLKDRINELKDSKGLYEVDGQTVSKSEAISRLKEDEEELESTQDLLSRNENIISGNLNTLRTEKLQEEIENSRFGQNQKLREGNLEDLKIGIDIPLVGEKGKPDATLTGTGAKVAAGFDTFTTGGKSGKLVGSVFDKDVSASEVIGERVIQEKKEGSKFNAVDEAKETAGSVPGLIGTSLVGGAAFSAGGKAISAIPKVGSAASKAYQGIGAAAGAYTVGKEGLKAKKQFDKGKTAEGVGTLTELGASTYGFYKGASGTAARLKPRKTAEVSGSKFDLAVKNKETGTATGTGRAKVKVQKESPRPLVSNKKSTETVDVDFPYVQSGKGSSYAIGTAKRTNAKGETLDSGQYLLSSYTKAGKGSRDVGDMSIIGTKTQKVGEQGASFSESQNVLTGKIKRGNEVNYLSKSARSESEQGLINTKVELAGKGGSSGGRTAGSSGKGTASGGSSGGTTAGGSGGQQLKGMRKVEIKGGKDVKISESSIKDIALDASGSGAVGSKGTFGASIGEGQGTTKTASNLGQEQELQLGQQEGGSQELKPVERVSTKTKVSDVGFKGGIKPEVGLIGTRDTVDSQDVGIGTSDLTSGGTKIKERSKPVSRDVQSPKVGQKPKTEPVSDIKSISTPKVATASKSRFTSPQVKSLSPEIALSSRKIGRGGIKTGFDIDSSDETEELEFVNDKKAAKLKDSYSSSLSAELLDVKGKTKGEVDPVSIRPVQDEDFTF